MSMTPLNCAALLGLFLLSCGTVGAQSPAPVLVQDEPRHRPVLRNAQVMVLRIQIPAGDESLMHTHENDAVHITVQGSDIRETTPRGWWASNHAASPDGLTYFSALGGKPYTHQIRNTGSRDTHIVSVELLGSASGNPRVLDVLRGSEKIADNPRTRVERLKSDSAVAVPPSPANAVLVSLRAGTLSGLEVANAMSPGSVHWIPAGTAVQVEAAPGSGNDVIYVRLR